MKIRPRLGVRLSVAALIAAVPVSLVALAPSVVPTAPDSTSAGPDGSPSAEITVSNLTPDVVAAKDAAFTRSGSNLIAPETTIFGTVSAMLGQRGGSKIMLDTEKGDRVFTASSLADHDIPSAALRAYKRAARAANASNPVCHLPWSLLAGIGRVESDHGRYGGSVLGSDGIPRPAIVGVALNGQGAVAAVPDTDNGRYDGDTVWDRAVGPMQFIPSTWRTSGRDGDGDGIKNPNDINDAALAAADYLCSGGRDIATVSGERAAIFSYNPSDYYVSLVSAFAHGYQTGAFSIPSPSVPAGAGGGVVPAFDYGSNTNSAATMRSQMAAYRSEAAQRSSHARALREARAEARAKRAHEHRHHSKHGDTSKKHDKSRSDDTSKRHGKNHGHGKNNGHGNHSGHGNPGSKATTATVIGTITAVADDENWTLTPADGAAAVVFTDQDLTDMLARQGQGTVTVPDWDNDGNSEETVGEELAGVMDAEMTVTVTYTYRAKTGVETVSAFTPTPTPTPTTTPSDPASPSDPESSSSPSASTSPSASGSATGTSSVPSTPAAHRSGAASHTASAAAPTVSPTTSASPTASASATATATP